MLVILSSLTACSPESTIPDNTRLQLIDGRQLTLASIPERVTIIYFWATSCAICRAEQAELTRLYQRYHKEGLELIAVAMPYDRPDEVLRYVHAKQVSYPVALDLRGTVAQAFGGIIGTPTSFVLLPIEKLGQKIVEQKIVGSINFNKLENQLASLLQTNASNRGSAN